MTRFKEDREGVQQGMGGGTIGAYLRVMRPHQWAKNLLVFVAPVMAHRISDWEAMGIAGLAFFSFSLCASSGYIFNDILDRTADREHPIKSQRPLASGEISPSRAAILIPILLLISFGLGSLFSLQFLGVLALYLVSTLAYSWKLKAAAIIDVLVLAGLYTLRVIGGGEATSTPLSFWLLAFSMFLFLSLALVKRYAELSRLVTLGKDRSMRRGYYAVDLETLAQFGTSSGFVAVLVLALYINSVNVQTLYSRPEVIWLLCPIMLYLISRVWLLARRKELEDDPLVFLLNDRRSQGLILLGGALFWLAA